MGIDGRTLIKDGWFMEKGALWPGQAMGLEVETVLHHSKSALQDILVFKSKTYGNVLVLDGAIQCTERDEFAYHEMIAHVPLYAHREPRDVLVIGGGDGGVIREVLKHSSVQTATLCDIDADVTKVAMRYFSDLTQALSDARVTQVCEDGASFLQRHKASYDVIIADTSDPIGPAEVLFDKSFYKSMSVALRPGGVLCTQGECLWLHGNIIRPLLNDCRQIFPTVQYAYTMIPTYPSGQIGFILCGDSDMDFSKPVRLPSQAMQERFRYYNTEIHSAAFVLPQFARKLIEG